MKKTRRREIIAASGDGIRRFPALRHSVRPAAHRYGFETERDAVEFRTIRDLEEAKAVAAELQGRGFGAIEVCGAFGEDGARQLAEATGEKVALGYIVHDSRMDGLFASFFG